MTIETAALPVPIAKTGSPPVLDLDQVCVKLGPHEVLHDVSFHLRAGEFAGVIGSNGAGKTTLLRTILGLNPVSRGKLCVFGQPARRGNPAIGYVPQHQDLDPDLPMRARDFVRLGLDGAHWGVGLPNAERARRVDKALDSVGALSYGNAPVGRLSGGQQQRLLLAQATVGSPRLLLLDEPLANLDLRSRWEVVNLVQCMARERNIAVMLVAHDINPLLDAMDSVIYLAHGRAVSGSVNQVVRSSVLSHLYGFPVDVVHAQGHVLVVGASESDCHA